LNGLHEGNKERILAFLQSREDELFDFTRKLLRIDTVNPPGKEDPVIWAVSDLFDHFGIPYTVFPHGNGRSSILGILRGIDEKPGLLMAGHGDTVPIGNAKWNHQPFGAEIEDGRLYGRGASDMKSGVAAMVFAAGALAGLGIQLKGDLLVAVTAGEETDSLGAREVVKSSWIKKVSYGLIAEPTDLNLLVAEKGALWVRLEAFGITAHGSMPSIGVNAVELLAELTAWWKEEWSCKWTPESHPLLGMATISLNSFSGGSAPNVVPDHAEAIIDMRTLTGQDHGKILDAISSRMASQEQAHHGLRFKLQILNDRPPVDIPVDHPLVKSLKNTVESVAGFTPSYGGAAFYTDASVFGPQGGIPMVVCGPGNMETMHKADEYVEISKLCKAAEIYACWAAELLG
jgi:succinyl-diaminopimelate desuccinylase